MSDSRRVVKFVDLFAGIGGFHAAVHLAGLPGECVLAVENDKWCRKTYEHQYPGTPFVSDVRDVTRLPDCDVVFGGFPCQPFSIAGVSKYRSMGKPDGFAHEGKGDLFFEAMRLVRVARPKVFLFENVKNLLTHNKGRTLERIRDVVAGAGYRLRVFLLDAAQVVPQHRDRVFLVGIRDDIHMGIEPIVIPSYPHKLRDILEPEERVPDRYWLTPKLWAYLQAYKERHAAKGHGFGYGLADLDGVTRTLSARYYKDGSEILVPTSWETPRRLMPIECARLMGFPRSYEDIVVSDTQAYRQFGNAVVPELVRYILPCLFRLATV